MPQKALLIMQLVQVPIAAINGKKRIFPTDATTEAHIAAVINSAVIYSGCVAGHHGESLRLPNNECSTQRHIAGVCSCRRR